MIADALKALYALLRPGLARAADRHARAADRLDAALREVSKK